MKKWAAILFVIFTVLCAGKSPGQEVILPPETPEALRAWEGWVLWKDSHRTCPPSHSDPTKHFCFWPSTLSLDLSATGGTFESSVRLYSETWIFLPGNNKAWPLDVQANGAPVPVLQHAGRPAALLPAGEYRLQGRFVWENLPQNLQLPRETGILRLTLLGQPVESPTWNAEGLLWLRRDRDAEEADQDFLSLKMYAKLEDGIPLWLDTELELLVAGKSREEDLGTVLPAGWKLTQVESPLPVAIDDEGRLKAQVRAGKWTVKLRAFRLDDPRELRFPEGAKPAVEEALLGFESRPEFRMVEITGAPVVDVSQTTFPDAWRALPVFRWETAEALAIEERMRGMGQQSASALTITREWWLDENGKEVTFRDRLSGQRQTVWRLDAAAGQELGSVRSDGAGQLITKNPETGAPGVEVRSRNLDLEATGRAGRTGNMRATGWMANAEGVSVTLNLPPGWRLFALFGADWVRGDWLTAWSLLDLFLLLVFSLAVFRLHGFLAACLAFFAFALSYQEPGAARYAWLVLLLPIALLRVVPEGWMRTVTLWFKWGAVAVLVVLLVPFLALQIQQMLFPQLEKVAPQIAMGGMAAESAAFQEMSEGQILNEPAPAQRDSYAGIVSRAPKESVKQWESSKSLKSNLLFDSKARIQTGPGVPEWTWRTVSFGWNGPVQSSQTVRPVLVSPGLERFVTLLRILLLLGLGAVLLRRKSTPNSESVPPPLPGAAVLAVCLAMLYPGPLSAQGQFPAPELLEEFRERLLKPSEAFPNAAQIPSVALKLEDRRLSMTVEIHTAARVAVPLPGGLPAWSPLSVTVDGTPVAVLRREDGFLWVVLEPGVHRVSVEGLLGEATEWEWTFLLLPRRVSIDAKEWTHSGVQPDGIPEKQIFFARKQRDTSGEALYDRQDFQSLALVERHLELGLVWQVRTTVTRLSQGGKAISLRIPLLAGEQVLNANAVVQNGMIEVRLGAQEPSFAWESELPLNDKIQLPSQKDNTWVERWHLVVSPVWNVAISGLPPVFEADNAGLVPVWNPWPGEGVELVMSRPEAIPGETVTVSQVKHEITLGRRQRVSQLDLSVRASLGEDFLIELPEAAEITSLRHHDRDLPVRKDGNRIIIPLHPGDQQIAVGWRSNQPLGFKAAADPVNLPVESANVTTVVRVPQDRWVLCTHGPLRGPAVRFWTIVTAALLAAWILGRLPHSPLRTVEWALLALGLTQVPLPAALVVVGWLFLLVWRGRESFLRLPAAVFNLLQLCIACATLIALVVLVTVVAAGLLGNPEMFILGNGSSRTVLNWFQARSDAVLPQPGAWSVSIWWYRLLMLAWALWLAASLIRWLRWAWTRFSLENLWKPTVKRPPATPPPVPTE